VTAAALEASQILEETEDCCILGKIVSTPEFEKYISRDDSINRGGNDSEEHDMSVEAAGPSIKV